MKGDKINYLDGYKYLLAEQYRIQTAIHPPRPIEAEYLAMTTDGLLTIKAGYAWDGASGPTFDSASSMRGSLVHDALYQLMRQDLLPMSFRPAADKVLHDLLIEDGMWRWRAKLWHREVAKWAASAALPENDRKVRTAP